MTTTMAPPPSVMTLCEFVRRWPDTNMTDTRRIVYRFMGKRPGSGNDIELTLSEVVALRAIQRAYLTLGAGRHRGDANDQALTAVAQAALGGVSGVVAVSGSHIAPAGNLVALVTSGDGHLLLDMDRIRVEVEEAL